MVHDPEKPVYNVFIGVGTNVIDNPEIQNSDTFGELIDRGPRVFKFMQPTEEAVKRVEGCVRATVLSCLDNYRNP